MRPRRVFVVLALLAASCTTEDDPCPSAAAHVAACTGEEPSLPGDTCDETRAETILGTDCDELADVAAAGKADGWWDDFLCLLGFSSHCSTPVTAKALTGFVNKIGGTGAANVWVRAVPAGGGEEAWALTTLDGVFVLPNLPITTYAVEVQLAKNTLPIATRSVDLAKETFVGFYVALP